MDNIIFQKIWVDDNPSEDLFQMRITASNERISMSSEVYAQTDHLHRMREGLKDILKRPYSVILGNDDDGPVDCVKLSFVADRHGRIRISVHMKSRAFENMNNTAHFIVMTDVASVDRFAAGLFRIAKGDIGAKIQLHE